MPVTTIHDCTLYLGDALDLLRHLPTASAAATITDPPYSSGGFTRSDRNQAPAKKYVQTGTTLQRENFSGDNRDQRSWHYWCTLWLTECLRITEPSGYCLMFTDWRQLPTAADALQAAGWVWRGVVAWDKGRGARAPHTGFFRHQCEYIVWGTNGTSKPADHGGPWDGCLKYPVKQSEKQHMTGKPIGLMERLVRVVKPGGVVLDPFCGSGTTAVACAHEGRACVAIENSAHYHAIAAARVRKAYDRWPLLQPLEMQTRKLTTELDPLTYELLRE